MIYITGSTGFVGSNLKSKLSNNNVVFCEIPREKLSDFFNFKLNEKNEEAIVHLAGKAHDLKKTSLTQEYFEVNFELTKRLFDNFLLSNIKTFVFVSSVKAVIDSTNEIVNENTTPNPKTPYGESKLLAEQYILSKNIEGKKVYILRPCMIYGPKNKGNLTLLYQMVKKGIPYPLGRFENKRSYLSIDNLCFVIEELLNNSSIDSGIYTVSDNETFSTNELVKLIGESLNRKPLVLSFPKSVVNFVAQIGDLLNLPLTTDRLQKLTENYVVSNTKIKKAIGKDFPVNGSEGLLNTFTSFNSQ